jgi:hypothetical protein
VLNVEAHAHILHAFINDDYVGKHIDILSFAIIGTSGVHNKCRNRNIIQVRLSYYIFRYKSI